MQDRNIEVAVGRTLRWGIRISSLLMALGLVLLFALFGTTGAHEVPSIKEVILLFHSDGGLRIALGNPYLYLYTGILILMLTPIARVAIALIGFTVEKDWRFVLVSLVVLSVIMGSIFYALAGG
jgi:uncharacterized membrane protein